MDGYLKDFMFVAAFLTFFPVSVSIATKTNIGKTNAATEGTCLGFSHDQTFIKTAGSDPETAI